MTPIDSRVSLACDSETIAARREALRQRLRVAGFDAALLTYHRDVLYYTGTAQPANLLVFEAQDSILFVRRAFDLTKEGSPWMSRDRAA